MIYSKMYIGGSEVIETEGYNISKSISENNSSSSFDLEVNNPYGRNSDNYQIGQEVKVYAEMGSLIYTAGSPLNYETFNWSTIPSGGISSLYIHHKFNTSGTIVTSDVNSYSGLCYSGVSWENGKIGSCIGLNGSPSYIELGQVFYPGYNDFSISAWIKPKAIQGDIIFKGVNQTGSMGVLLRYQGAGYITFGTLSGLGFGSSFSSSAGTAPANTWTHVTAVKSFSGTAAYIYINGQLSASGNVFNWVNSGTGKTLHVGCGINGTFYSGLIDDLRIYNNALGSTQISLIYNSGAGTETNIFSGSDTFISGTNLYNYSPYGTSGLMNSVKFVEGKLGNCYDFDGQTSYIDIETPPNIPSYSYGATATEPRSIWFSSDGLNLYVCDSADNNINYYTLGTAWDITSASHTGDFATGVTDPIGLYIKSDGITFWVVNYNTDTIRQYHMVTPWDMSSAVYDTVEKALTETVIPSGVYWSTDGMHFYVTCQTNDAIYQYDCTSAWDISTASYSISRYIGYIEGGVGQIWIDDTGHKLWIVGTSDYISQWYMTTAWDLSTLKLTNIRLYIVSLDTTAQGLFFRNNGTDVYVSGLGSDLIKKITLQQAWDLSDSRFGTSTDEVSKLAFIYGPDVDGATGYLSDGMHFFEFNNDGTKLYCGNATNDKIMQFSLSTAYDISTYSYDSKFIDTTSPDTAVSSMFFNPTGYKMWLIGRTNDRIYEWDLSTPYDISTAVYNSVSVSYTSGGASDAYGLFISPDGLNVYLADNGSNYIYQYSLSTPWDITSLTYVQRFYDSNLKEQTPVGLWFNSTGTLMYLSGQFSGAITKFYLDTPWDLSTAHSSYEQLSMCNENANLCVKLNPTGTKLYLSGTTQDGIAQYDLTNAFCFDEPDSGFSISAWIYPRTTGRLQTASIIGYGNSALLNGFSLMMHSSNNRVRWYINNSSLQYSAVNSVPMNTWTHIAVVQNANGKQQMWINGVKQTVSDYPIHCTAPVCTITSYPLSKVCIGNFKVPQSYAFDGKIDDVRLYSKLLSEEDILSIYNQGNGTERINNEDTVLYSNIDVSQVANTGSEILNTQTILGSSFYDYSLTYSGANISYTGSQLNGSGYVGSEITIPSPYDPGLLFYSRFNTSGTSTKNEIDGTIGSIYSPVLFTSGLLGSSVATYSNGSGILFSSNPSLTGSWSMATWVFYDSVTAGNQTIMDVGHVAASNGFGWYVSGNRKITWRVNANWPNYSATNIALDAGSWNHLVMTYMAAPQEGSGLRIWKNGSLAYTNGSVFTPVAVTNYLRFFTREGATSEFLRGKVDDARLYNYVLGSSQIQQMFNNGVGSEYASGAEVYGDSYYYDYTNTYSGTNITNSGSVLTGSQVINSVDLNNYDNLYNLVIPTYFTISGQKLFDGLLEDIQFKGKGLNESIRLSGRDYTAYMQDRTVEPEVYNNLPAGSIVKDIISKYASELYTSGVTI